MKIVLTVLQIAGWCFCILVVSRFVAEVLLAIRWRLIRRKARHGVHNGPLNVRTRLRATITLDPEDFTPDGWTYRGRFGIDLAATAAVMVAGKGMTAPGTPIWTADYPDAEWPKDMVL